MPKSYDSVFLTGTGLFLPGPPIDNDSIGRFIAPFNQTSSRLKDKILRENGIETRHYAMDEDDNSMYSSWDLAAEAVHDCLDDAGARLEDVSLLCTGSTGGDTLVPGFANMLQGTLGAGPMATSSHQGVCAAGVVAAQHAANAIQLGHHERAMVVASEYASRLFKRSRFASSGDNTDFDSHFLRWMLSDGAGAMLLDHQPRSNGLSLKLEWIHTQSFSGDYPVCMQLGYGKNGNGRSYLDYPTLADAESEGAFALRQDIRLLPNLFDVAVHEYAKLVNDGYVSPASIDHLLCHYSSEKFAPVVETLMEKAQLAIPRQRWYSNLVQRGNTGAASIFIMLADFLRSGRLELGDKVLCFVPESGRFSVAFMLLEAIAPTTNRTRSASVTEPPPVTAETAGVDAELASLLIELATIWQDYRSRLWRTPLVRRITTNRFDRDTYLRWMACWIPQVREGSKWMREAARNLQPPFADLADVIDEHAGEEQGDYQIMFDDYKESGGLAGGIDELRRNPGGEALNAFMFAKAKGDSPIGLLGAIYIIEGTGQRVIPALLPMLKKQLRLPGRMFRFLTYHGENDIRHLARWTEVVRRVLEHDSSGEARKDIVRTAKQTAELYLMQFDHVL